jgi:hypothetical protein
MCIANVYYFHKIKNKPNSEQSFVKCSSVSRSLGLVLTVTQGCWFACKATVNPSSQIIIVKQRFVNSVRFGQIL